MPARLLMVPWCRVDVEVSVDRDVDVDGDVNVDAHVNAHDHVPFNRIGHTNGNGNGLLMFRSIGPRIYRS